MRPLDVSKMFTEIILPHWLIQRAREIWVINVAEIRVFVLNQVINQQEKVSSGHTVKYTDKSGRHRQYSQPFL